MSDNKILLIGIDGGTWTTLQPAIDNGSMPCLANLMQKGASGILESTLPAITPAAWSSFQTGRLPGQHGVYDFVNWDNTRKKAVTINSTLLSNTMWELASKAGKKVGVLNVPVTYPPKSINGEIVAGLFSPDTDSEFTSPADFRPKLLNAVSGYDILNQRNNAVYPSQTSVKDFVNIMNQNLDWRLDAARFMISQNDYDLFMVHYHASDIVQHGLWGFMDPSHKLYDQEKQKYIFDNFYNHLDSNIEKTIQTFTQKCGQEPYVFIISDHGFQSNLMQINMAQWLLENNFIDQEYINHMVSQKKKPKKLLTSAKKLGIGKLVRKIMPDNAVEKIEHKTNLKNPYRDYNYSGSKVVYSGGCQYAFIHFLDENNKSTLFEEMKNKLMMLKDPNTGEAVVEQILTRSEAFPGEKNSLMPDMTLVVKDKWSFVFDTESKQSIEPVSFQKAKHVGTHHKNGILITSGNNIKPAIKVNAHITDIAPTVISLLNIQTDVPIFNGKPLSNIWDNCDPFDQNGTKTIVETEKEVLLDYQKTAQPDKTIENRLKDLGYM